MSIFTRHRGYALIVGIALVMSFAGGACSKHDDGEGLRVAIVASPRGLDPRTATDAEGSKITALIFDGLMAFDDELNIVPALAESYEQPNATTYRFHLRKGVLFHSGAPFTADDVIYTFRSIVDPATRSPYKSAFDRIRGMRALDPHTLLIELKEPYAPFLTAMKVKIVSKDEPDKPVGTGRYVLKRFVPESAIVLDANPHYWGGVPKQKRLIFKVIKEDNVRVLKLMKGDVDLVQNGVPPLLVKKVLERPQLAMKEDVGIVSTYMGLNLKDPVLRKREVRQAIARAIDVEGIIRWRWRGLATRANSIIAPAIWAHDSNLKPVPFDPGEAKRLLDEAGYPDPDGDGPEMRFEIEYKTTTMKLRIDIARMIARQLREVGIGVRLRAYEWGTFFRDVRTGNFQMYTLSWTGVTEPDIFYDTCHSTQMPPVGLNRDRYSNPEVDRLVEQGRLTMNRGERKRIYDRVQAILLRDLPFIPLWYEKNWIVYRRDLAGVSLRPDAAYVPLANVVKE